MVGFAYEREQSRSADDLRTIYPTLRVATIDLQSSMVTKQDNFVLSSSSSSSGMVSGGNHPILQWNSTGGRKLVIYDDDEEEPGKQRTGSDSDSSDYEDPKEDILDGENCFIAYEWQNKTLPNCNNLHEQSLVQEETKPRSVKQFSAENKFLLGKGSFRQVWKLSRPVSILGEAQEEAVALKVSRLDKWTDRDILTGNHIDALVSERLSSSPHISDIYGYCGNSALYEYSNGGSLFDAIGAAEYDDVPRDLKAQKDYATWTTRRKMNLAYQAVQAVADLHGMDGPRPSVVHGDLDVTQFVTYDGGNTYKLSDFNGATFIYFNPKKHNGCLFDTRMSGGKTRSPEEYANEMVSEKIDIYALGNVLYTIATGSYPFQNLGTSELTKQMVMRGIRPSLKNLLETGDPLMEALVQAMRMCWKENPRERPSAAKLREILQGYV